MANDFIFNNENEKMNTINTINKDNNNEKAKNNSIIITFTIIVFIKNRKNKEYSLMIYIVNVNKNKNERKFELFTNKKKSDKDYNISVKLQDIIPCKDIISVNYDIGKDNINLCYQKERKKQLINKGKLISLFKYNYFSSFYSYLYLNKTNINININFSSKYILNEFIDYYKKIKYNISKKKEK